MGLKGEAMTTSAREEILRLLREDAEVRHAVVEALASELPSLAQLMKRAHEAYPLKLRQ